jgi:YbbR domain-containing protein
MRILVLVAAVLLWLNVYGLQNRQMVLVAPVEITGLSPFHGVIEPITGIEVKLSGNARSLAGVNQNTLNFVIDLSNAEGVGEHNAEVKLNQSPPGVDIISFSPTHLTLTVNDRAEKVVPVNVSLKGSVADGYHVAGSTLANKYVTISGAGDLLEFISEAFVQIDLIYNIDVIPQTLAVEVNVAVGVATRTLGLTPHFVGELPGGYWVKEVIFDPAVVTIGGDDGTLKALTLIETTPIKLSNKRESFYESVGVSLPSNINVVGEGIISAHIIVERSLATKQLNIVPQFENVGDGFSVTSIEPATVRVVLSGEASALEKLTRTDVVLKINLEGVLSGVSSLALKSDMFTTGPSVSVVSFDPDNIEVILSRLE